MKKTILVIVIMSLLLSVCSCASSSSKEIESLNQKISELEKQGESTTDSVQSATTSQATTAETFVASPDFPYDYTTRPKSMVENFYFETLTVDQQDEIKRLEDMDYEDFVKLPENDQLKFAYWVLTNNKELYDRVFELTNVDLVYTENPTTAEQCAQNFDYIFTMAYQLIIVGPEQGLVFDYNTAKKFGVLLLTLSDVHVSHWGEDIDKLSAGIDLMDFNTSVISSERSGDTIIVHADQTERNGVIILPPGNDDVKLVFTNVTFTTITGKEVTISRCLSDTSEDR